MNQDKPDEAKHRMQEINEAYEVLSDVSKRKEYDNRYDKSKPWYKDLYIGKDQKQLEKQAEKH